MISLVYLCCTFYNEIVWRCFTEAAAQSLNPQVSEGTLRVARVGFPSSVAMLTTEELKFHEPSLPAAVTTD